jgi:hypothetical protein
MRDLQLLAGLRAQVRAPSYDALAEVARRRDRRTALLAAAGSAAVVLAVVAGALAVTRTGPDSSPAPVITPTPSPSPTPTPPPSPTHHSTTSMTPREVVQADNARLVLSAVSTDDPNFRLSVWEAVCTWCPRQGESRFPHPSFTGMAITNDGFLTTTYRHTKVIEFEEGGLVPVHPVSVGPGLILLVDGSNGGEWLVRDDGTITPQARKDDAKPTGNPRLWFPCLTGYEHLPWVNAPIPSSTWCKLDPEANTVRALGTSTWWGMNEIGHDTASLVSPRSAFRWGLRNQSFDRLVGWWDTGGSRHSKDFGAAKGSGVVENTPDGVMSYWAWPKGSPTMTVFTSSDHGASWHRSTLPMPPKPIRYYDLHLSWTPDGALLLRQDDAFEVTDSSGNTDFGIRLWRSSSPADGGAFTKVYEGTATDTDPASPAFTVNGSRIWSKGLWSDDDGQTWNTVPRWR